MYNFNTFYSRQLVESEMFPKTLSFFVFVGCFVFVFVLFCFNRRTSLEARLSVITLTFYLQLLQLGILYKTFLFPFAIRKLI